MSAKKLVVSTYQRYVFIALGAPVLFVLPTFLALEGNVPVSRIMHGFALYEVVGAIFAFAIVAAAPRETLPFERWLGLLVKPAHDEALPGARSFIAREG